MDLSGIKITEASKEVFINYANDAGNWSGTPLVGGNVNSAAKDRGYLTALKKQGLITTFYDDGNTWLSFTKLGVAYAHSLGINMIDWDCHRAFVTELTQEAK